MIVLSKFDYWQEEVIHNVYEEKLKEIEKILSKQYRTITKEIIELIKDLWLEMLEDGEISADTLYKKNRNSKLQKLIKKKLKYLGDKELFYLEELLYDVYFDVYENTSKHKKADKNKALKMLTAIYFGYTLSQRIYNNKNSIRSLINKQILNNALNGANVNITVNQTKSTLNKALSKTENLAKTEIMRAANEAQKDAYEDGKYKEYTLMATLDKNTCLECQALDGSVFEFKDAEVGVNYPPFHSCCRCSAVPIE